MCFLLSIIFDHHAFMAHIVRMFGNTAQFYLEAQDEQKCILVLLLIFI